MKRYIFILVCLSYTTLYGLTSGINSKDAKGTAATVVYHNMSSGKEMAKPDVRLDIYPNPVMDVVHIAGLGGTYTVKMMDAVGQVVASVKGSTAELELDLRDMPAGMYLVKIESPGKSITRKLIKK